MKVRVITFLCAAIWFAISFAQTNPMPSIGTIEYDAIIGEKLDKIKIVNFWATWCGPCLKELPVFTQLDEEIAEKAEIILVSIDSEKLKKKVTETLSRFDYTGRAYLLDIADKEFDVIHKNWTGAAPLTLVYNDRNQLIVAFEKEIDYLTLIRLIN